MKKIIASLALTAALGVGFTAGAQAQTFPQTTLAGNNNIYSLAVNATVTNLAPSDYEYSYLVTLTGNQSGASVNKFTIDNIAGYITGTAGVFDGIGSGNPPAGYQTSGATVTTATGITTLDYISATGFLHAGTPVTTTFGPGIPLEGIGSGDTENFFFQSTLPPTATVSLGTNAKNPTNKSQVVNGNLAGTGGAIGPGAATPTIPETSSFALLGLGLLPLGFLARRRLARNN